MSWMLLSSHVIIRVLIVFYSIKICSWVVITEQKVVDFKGCSYIEILGSNFYLESEMLLYNNQDWICQEKDEIKEMG